MTEWKTMDDPIPDNVRHVVFYDANMRMACFAPHVDVVRKWPRRNWFVKFLLTIGALKPKATHWLAVKSPPGEISAND